MSSDEARQYLLEYLRDEFRRYPEVRIRVVPYSKEDGVTVKTESREYFFETEWMQKKRFSEILALIGKVKEALPDRG